MFIPGTPVGVKHGPAVPEAQKNPSPANLQPQKNPQLAANNPAQIQQAFPMFILGTRVRVQDAPRRIFKPMTWRGEYLSPRPICPQLVSFRNNADVFVITY